MRGDFQWGLQIQEPLLGPEWGQEGGECISVVEMSGVAEELQLAGFVGRSEFLQHEPTKQRRKDEA
jgi:hypothetical protein